MDPAPGALLDDPRLRGPLDVDEYYQLATDGVLPGNARVELIEGELAWRNAIGSPHAGVVNRLNRMLTRAAGGRALVSIQNPVRLDLRNEPEPDVALLVPRADDYRGAHPSAADVLLLIEVADSSLPFDRGRKRVLYARFGIREYWIVDLDGSEVEVFRQPTAGVYASSETAGLEAVLTVDALPGVQLPVREIFL